MEMYKGLPLLTFSSMADWLAWLETNHALDDAVWLKFAKKSSGIQSIKYEEARNGALMYGWIDGLANPWDDAWYVQRFTPRRKRSVWSAINRALAEQFITDNLMRPSGLLEVERAKADGRWDAAYASQSTVEIPPDFAAILDANPDAKRFFDSMSRSNRYAFLYRIITAKKPETRAARIAANLDMLMQGKMHHPKKRPV